MTRRPRKRLTLVMALATALVAVPAATANAALIETGACDDAALSQPFKAWGDGASYKLAPGGDFEGSLEAWTLSGGARKVAGSEKYGATGEVGAFSVSLPAGASITSPATCVNADYPSLRFFSKSSGGLLGLLPAMKVDVLYGEGLAKIVPLPAGVGLPSSSWQPTTPMLTNALLGAALAGGEAPIRIRITSVAGTWGVDDVFVDPFRRS